MLDRDKLVARNKVVPGSPAESELYQRVHSGEMVWDLESGRQVQGVAAPEEVGVGCLAFAQDRHSALSGGSDRARSRQ